MNGGCVVIGAVNVDLLGTTRRFCGADEAEGLTEVRTEPGGHAANCAAALARLGSPVSLVAAVGRDEHGSLVRAAMAAAGVDTDHVQVVGDSPTGLAFVFVLPTGERAMYLMPGANRQLSAGGLEAALAGAGFVVYFNPPREIGSAVARTAAPAPILFAPGGAAAREVELADPALLAAASYMVVNAPESRELTQLESPREGALALSSRWDLCAIVTDGDRGCWVAGEGAVEHQDSYAVATADSTGAGDAFVGGFVHALGRGEGVSGAARFGCAVGALATREVGAQASLPTRSEIGPLLAAQAGG